MNIFWKNYIYISILLTILCIIFTLIVPIQSHDMLLKSILSENKFNVFVYFLMILVVSGLISYLCSRSINTLIIKTNTEINEVIRSDNKQHGEYQINENNKSSIEDKLLYLRNSIKESIKALIKNIKSLESENNQLLILINAINEGIAVISRKGTIISSNHQFNQIFEITSDPKGRPFWEVIRINEITELIESALQKRQSIIKEVSIIHPVQKYYFINIISPSSSADEIIAIFFDITEFKNLEKIKADLIANVSHELRTPLTAIKGYVETLENKAYDTAEEKLRFLNIIKKHTDRLINIVSDLLILSEIEDREHEHAAISGDQPFEYISINNILNSCHDSLLEKVKAKNLIFEKNITYNLPVMYGNSFLLEQAFINLIDNAIKYTTDGGKLGILTSSNDGSINIEIFDTGIGIPKESIPRIFERFYRVDKDRSRKEGGTGLGLSIVKHVINLHNGDIKVESEIGEGTRFIIKLPVTKREIHNS